MAEQITRARSVADRLSLLSRKQRFALALSGGILSGLGQVPFSIELLGFLGLVVGFLSLVTAPDLRRAAIMGWAFGLGHFATTLNWIVEPFLVDIARHGWMAPFALVFLSGGLALFWAAAFALAHRFGRSPLRRAIIWPFALALAELARAYVLTGFPWALIGYLWTESQALQWVSLVGPHGLTLLTLLAASPIGLAILSRGHPAWNAAAFLPVALLLAGGVWLDPAASDVGPDRPVIRLVQPNAPQDEKWDREKAPIFFARQLGFTAAEASTRPDLVVWPETSIPYLLGRAGPALEQISDAAGGTPVVIGAQRRAGPEARNSLAVIGSGGSIDAVYDKYHLVPFGEYIPFGRLTRLIGLRSFAAQDGYGYTPGPGPQLLDLGSLGSALPLICYEAIFPQDVSAAPSRPDWLLQITNDAWFGEFSGPYQHLAQARSRAVEQGLPMVRVANTGVSAMIGPDGRILAQIPLGEAGFIDAALPAPLSPTLYARTGDWPVFVLILATFSAFLALRPAKSD